MKEQYHRWIMAAFVGLVMFGAGYMMGYSAALTKVYNVAVGYLEYKNISLGISYVELRDFAFKFFSMKNI